MKDQTGSSISYPVRINKYLADKGLVSRREADTLVEKGLVSINGKKAVIGAKVHKDDEVKIHVKDTAKNYVYYVLNKPIGVDSSRSTTARDVFSYLPKNAQKKDVVVLGRLDLDSHGLVFLTNDKRLSKRLLEPTYEHEKEYVVKTRRALMQGQITALQTGVHIGEYVTKPSRVERISEKTLRMTLTEGKKHQIRRMLAAVRNDVVDLKRVRIGVLTLGTLPSGAIRTLTKMEVEKLLASVGLKD